MIGELMAPGDVRDFAWLAAGGAWGRGALAQGAQTAGAMPPIGAA